MLKSDFLWSLLFTSTLTTPQKKQQQQQQQQRTQEHLQNPLLIILSWVTTAQLPMT
jgi:hypothetical protein